MLGSEYLPEWEGSILFLEDVGEDVYRIDRMLTQLKLAGVLDKISGFAFGRCTDCNPSNSFSLSLEQVLKDHIQSIKIPAFYGSMIGHIDNMFTIPVGVQAEINADDGSIRLLEVPTV
jgi:muramoyltetrapeptide carboxypeptidase